MKVLIILILLLDQTSSDYDLLVAQLPKDSNLNKVDKITQTYTHTRTHTHTHTNTHTHTHTHLQSVFFVNMKLRTMCFGLTLFRMGIFRSTHEWGPQKAPLPRT